MIKNLKNTASLLALLAGLSIPTSSFAEEKKDLNTIVAPPSISEVKKEEEKIVQHDFSKKSRNYNLGLGFNIAHIPESKGTKNFLSEDREMFNKSMPVGDNHTVFGKFLKIAEIKPTIELSAGFDLFGILNYHMLPKDGLTIGPYVGFGSSHIFGPVKDKKVFDAEIEHALLKEPAQLGKTPTSWTQFMDYLVTFGADIGYTFHEANPQWLGKDWGFSVGANVRAGAFYIKSSSELDIFVDSEGPFTGYLANGDELVLGWDLMNKIANTYQNIVTEAVSEGWGGEVYPHLSLEGRFESFGIELKIGYQWQFQPKLKVTKTSSYDMTDRVQRETGKVEESVTRINNDTHGVAGTILFKYYLPSTK